MESRTIYLKKTIEVEEYKKHAGEKWCQGCLVKIKPRAKNCSYCGKSTEEFYTKDDFNEDGELLMPIPLTPPPIFEIVICAAVKTTDGKVFRGHRHSDCIRAINSRGLEINTDPKAQGFITSRNRYVTREEGRQLQDAAGIKSANSAGYMGQTLFSEDLY